MRTVVWAVVFPAMLMLFAPMPLSAPRAEGDCTITLGTDPEPPECVANPDGIVSIFWDIEHSTTPDFVYYRMTNPEDETVEDELYPGEDGITVTREWTVPEGALEGSYWVHVEYWSEEVGLEGVAEVVFLVCGPTPVDPDSWGSVKKRFGD
ncbi:MAG: hypothetical protein GF330_06635 [Candidatus Eisenbacteria bacterium]|nr:hypothetical protein [Candidatus Eisenbacteria bacterium]